jgi:hypothetical protein
VTAAGCGTAAEASTLPLMAAKKAAGGRPPRREEASTAVFQVRCTEAEHTAWMAAAQAQGVKLADVVREYLRRWAAKR